MSQGLLGFQYEAEAQGSGATGLAGLGLYFELMGAMDLGGAVRRHLQVAGERGWLDIQMVVTLLALNLAGGDRVEDVERLSCDRGFTALLGETEKALLRRRERRSLKARMRRGGQQKVPSSTALRDWLEKFHDPSAEALREPGTAYIPAATTALRGLWAVNRSIVGFLQGHRPEPVATLDMDATLIETHKRQALFCYKKFRAYQPLNCWWAEHQVMLHSEFRDGNVPAGYQHLRVLKDSLAGLPLGVRKVRLRTDTAGYLQDLLLYCGEGKDPRLGVIEFAVGADVSDALRQAVLAVPEADWQPLLREVDDQLQDTGQQWAEVPYVPNWAGYSKKRADYRFVAIREPLGQLELGDAEQLPFPTEVFGAKGRHKLFALVTNLKWPGDQLIWWHRERCGKSEEVHAVLKGDLAGGTLPSGRFGANAAWWALAILAHNLNAIMKRLVLGPAWVAKRMKALRFSVIALPGRVIRHARRLILRLPAQHPALDLLLTARRTIQALAQGHSP
jgi:hypothetical protein